MVILAGFYNLTGQKDKALEWYRKAAALDPEDSNAQMILARFLYTEKKTDEAETLVAQILKKRPKLADARMLKSEILILQKKYQDALDILTALEKEEPKAHRVQYFKGLSYIGLGEPNQAIVITSYSIHYTKLYDG